MKPFRHLACIGLIAANVFITSCSLERKQASTASPYEKCAEDICASMTLEEPVQYNQPMDLTITVASEGDYPDLLIAPGTSNKEVVYFTDESWEIHATPGMSQTFKTNVTFSAPGYWDIWMVVFDKNRGGPILSIYMRLYIDEKGPSVINPTFPPKGTDNYP